MSTKKIADIEPIRVCRHPEHKPATGMCWEPGIYEHTCPSCGKKSTFVVRGTYT